MYTKMHPRTTGIPIVLKEKNRQETCNRQEEISFLRAGGRRMFN